MEIKNSSSLNTSFLCLETRSFFVFRHELFASHAARTDLFNREKEKGDEDDQLSAGARGNS